jgi:hypothetical protein
MHSIQQHIHSSLSSTLVFLIAVCSVENLYWDAELRSELGMVARQRYQLSYAAPAGFF